ncbi:hypothetical protein ACD591_11435 [Rufibacter glacialis]|uniref:Uncharacterized protein n=1 Tax=Rufibacter glacialis TaxID=1259555 RepID=A0A5M8Q9W7_9BACT|nr:hypothetical protein [Rufibacter glacialis]KAA6431636.1 hypothetical protein FOE74_16060 [Rufibacter glacialis]GGK82782.1 hypothetical protein GCM10011405_33240 [Rufibacter glacialis]
MKINKRYSGTIIGGIFTLVSLLLTKTYIVPVVSVIPGVFIKSLLKLVIDNEPYSNVGIATIITLAILVCLPLAIFLKKGRTQEATNGLIAGILVIEYFLIHTLGFYIYWASRFNFRSDGQLIFGAVSSFPASSFGLLAVGLIIDSIKNSKNNISIAS